MHNGRSRNRFLRSTAIFAGCCALTLAATRSRAADAADAGACKGDDSGLTLPGGFCATIFADHIGHARHLVVADDGVVYVNTWSGRYYGNDTPHTGGFLVALKDTTGTGKADINERFGATVQSGAAGGTGIGIYNGWLYAELNDTIIKYPLKKGAILPGGKSRVVVRGLPLGGDHPMHPFAIDAGGDMYVDVATASNSCQEKNRTLKSPGKNPCTELETRGGVWRYDAKKTDQVFSPAERYATGIRNAEGFGVDAIGHHIFVTQHGRDQLHTNWPDIIKDADQEATLPAEEVMLLQKGGDYGWPECYYDPFQRSLVLAPEYGGDGKAIGLCAQKMAPVAAYPAHWAPNGMVLYNQKQFPVRYQKGLFIAFHGSWNRAPYAQGGYNVVYQALAGDHVAGGCEIFADGFAGADKSPGNAAHRPSGLAVGPDGALYVSDDVAGRIYRIVYRGGAGTADARPISCPSATEPPGPVSTARARPPEGTHPDAGSDGTVLSAPPGATPAMVALGDRVFHGLEGGATCTGCHGTDAKGTPLGPDLITNKWLWSNGSYAGIAATIAGGVAKPKRYRSPMPAMGGAQLSGDQVMAVSAYVWALNHRTQAPPETSSSSSGELLLPGERIFPESITASADGRIFIGSIGARRVFVVKPGGSTAEGWTEADADPSLGVLGVFANDKSSTLWACFSSVKPNGSASSVAAYDLQSGKLKGRFALPTAGAFCNDIAVGADGSTYVTDTSNNEVDRLRSGDQKLEVWAGNDAFGPKGSGVDGVSILGNRLFINTLNSNKIFGVAIEPDGRAGSIAEIRLDRAIERPDGMRSFRDRLLLVESGGVGRLSSLRINNDSGQLSTVKEGYPDGPVSVAVVGNTGYVLEGQLKGLRNPSAALHPFHATPVNLGAP